MSARSLNSSIPGSRSPSCTFVGRLTIKPRAPLASYSMSNTTLSEKFGSTSRRLATTNMPRARSKLGARTSGAMAIGRRPPARSWAAPGSVPATPSTAIINTNRSNGIMVTVDCPQSSARKKGREARPELGEETESDPSSAHPACSIGSNRPSEHSSTSHDKKCGTGAGRRMRRASQNGKLSRTPAKNRKLLILRDFLPSSGHLPGSGQAIDGNAP